MESHLLPTLDRKPTRRCSLTLSRIMTILIAFHVIGFRNFKSNHLHLQEFHSNKDPIMGNIVVVKQLYKLGTIVKISV